MPIRILLTEDHNVFREALRNGASAYVPKDASAGELMTALHSAIEGKRYLSAALSERAIESYAKLSRSAKSDLYDTLTSREREVLHLVVEGQTNSEIAKQLVVSTRTVESHRSNLMRKLNVHSTADLIRHAIRRGIIPE